MVEGAEVGGLEGRIVGGGGGEGHLEGHDGGVVYLLYENACLN